MIRSLASHVCLALALPALAGCAGSMGTMHTDNVTTKPVTTFDGSYRTTLHPTRSFGSSSASAWCDSPGQPVVTISGGTFTYAVPHPNIPGNATPIFPATVAADGSFSGQIVAGVLSGRIDSGQITGKIDGSACIYEFSGQRI